MSLLIFMLPLFFIAPIGVDAENSNALSVKERLPENQIDKEVTYYDLRMKPSQEQEIEVEVYNSSDQDVKALIQVNPGRTSDTGGIDYTRLKKKNDKSLIYPINELITTEEKVTIPANGSYVAKLQIKMPVEEFDGMIIGGIYVTEESEETTGQKDEGKNEGMAVVNKMAFVKGIKLTETDVEVKPDMKLIKTFASQVMYKNTVKATLQNPTATTIDDITINAQIYRKGQTEELYAAESTGYRMAPNSNFNYGIDLDSKAFSSGDYRIKLTAESKDTGQKWTFDDVFTITSEEARKLNETALDLVKDYTNVYILIGIALLMMILCLIFLLVLMKKKKKRRALEERRRRKKNQKKKIKESPSVEKKSPKRKE